MPSLFTRESLRNEPLPPQYLHPYFEYNSTTKCSLISGGKSLRSGTALNTPCIFSTSTSNHSAKPHCLASSRAACTRNCFFAASVTAAGARGGAGGRGGGAGAPGAAI